MMLQTAGLFLTLLACKGVLAQFQYGNTYINPYQPTNDRSRFQSALYCRYGTFYQVSPYHTDRSAYTERDIIDCCYWEDSRNMCCLDSASRSGVIVQTCRCSPNVVCGQPTTTGPTTTTTKAPTTTTEAPTTTTTVVTTTTPLVTLCPELTFRVLGGQSTSSNCPYNGAAHITTLGGRVITCNAVYVPATVSGVFKQTFLTAQFCTDMINENAAVQFELEYGSQKYAIKSPDFTLINGADGTSFLDIDSSLLTGLGPCQEHACPYEDSRMNGYVDYSNCKMFSYGASFAGTLDQTGLNVVDLQQNTGGCGSIDDFFGAANTMCFRSTSGENVACSGDAGAPVYCHAPITNEWIMIGVTAFRGLCDGEKDVKVIPFPG